VGLVATVLKQAPGAAKYGKKLLAMEDEVMRLRAENARLNEELAQYIEQWETLDGPQLSVLQYLGAHRDGNAAAIARAAGMNVQIADSSLRFLEALGYVVRAGKAEGRAARHALAAKGARYLKSRGF
jgi:DNA-binding MarR family transcriptional regulator